MNRSTLILVLGGALAVTAAAVGTYAVMSAGLDDEETEIVRTPPIQPDSTATPADSLTEGDDIVDNSAVDPSGDEDDTPTVIETPPITVPPAETAAEAAARRERATLAAERAALQVEADHLKRLELERHHEPPPPQPPPRPTVASCDPTALIRSVGRLTAECPTYTDPGRRSGCYAELERLNSELDSCN